VLRALDLKRLRAKMAGGALVDLRNVYTPDEVIAPASSGRVSASPALRRRTRPRPPERPQPFRLLHVQAWNEGGEDEAEVWCGRLAW
jgi:hypothetical protein